MNTDVRDLKRKGGGASSDGFDHSMSHIVAIACPGYLDMTYQRKSKTLMTQTRCLKRLPDNFEAEKIRHYIDYGYTVTYDIQEVRLHALVKYYCNSLVETRFR